jgi:hypothetical protein
MKAVEERGVGLGVLLCNVYIEHWGYCLLYVHHIFNSVST